MNRAKVISIVGLILAVLLLVAGAAFVVLYLKDAIFLRQGEADQSLLFWYLPFLFAGLGSIICGVVIGQSCWYRLKKPLVLFETENKKHE